MKFLAGIIFTFIIIGLYNKFSTKIYTISLRLSLFLNVFSRFIIFIFIIFLSGFILMNLFKIIS